MLEVFVLNTDSHELSGYTISVDSHFLIYNINLLILLLTLTLTTYINTF